MLELLSCYRVLLSFFGFFKGGGGGAAEFHSSLILKLGLMPEGFFPLFFEPSESVPVEMFSFMLPFVIPRRKYMVQSSIPL